MDKRITSLIAILILAAVIFASMYITQEKYGRVSLLIGQKPVTITGKILETGDKIVVKSTDGQIIEFNGPYVIEYLSKIDIKKIKLQQEANEIKKEEEALKKEKEKNNGSSEKE